MRIFVSYARVDKPYCLQIVNILDVHDVWYDDRLYAGQDWWKEILRRLDWCEGFVYLLSPESLASEYCRREFEIAQQAGRHIFPILIHKEANGKMPDNLKDLQYADFSGGITGDTVKALLNAIYLAEHSRTRRPTVPVSSSGDDEGILVADDAKLISLAASAMETGHFDNAVYLLKRAKENGYKSKFINIDAILKEAEIMLERQASTREMQRDYSQIVELVSHKMTQKLGCEAFAVFAKHYPNYDPRGIAKICANAAVLAGSSLNGGKPAEPLLPMLEWIPIPAGNVRVGGDQGGERYPVEAFQMSKYPITNLQYQAFIDDIKGYANAEWWSYSQAATDWRKQNPKPRVSSFKGDERPAEMVCWFDALAFCKWLSARSGSRITLPTIAQRLRAFQGDDDRQYPWGDTYDPMRCNTRESGIRMTTVVNRYPNGVSPYGVFDLAGNVWEWCLNGREDGSRSPELAGLDEKRIVHGGSFVSPCERSQASFLYFIPPQTTFASIGFRIVLLK